MRIRIDFDTRQLIPLTGRGRRRLKLGLLIAALLTPVVVFAAVTKPYDFSDGSVISASQVNANFDALVTAVNTPRKLSRVVGKCNDETDSGYYGCGRKLTFTKTRDDTYIRFVWSDNIRLNTAYGYGYWEVMFNRLSCAAPAPARYWYHVNTSGNSNFHIPTTVTGICNATSSGAMKAGTYDIEIRVVPQGGGSDFYLGWNEQPFLIEAEEVL